MVRSASARRSVSGGIAAATSVAERCRSGFISLYLDRLRRSAVRLVRYGRCASGECSGTMGLWAPAWRVVPATF
jgi:hypothetical protein